MESVAAWCTERGLAVDPYGVDISPALAELARHPCPSGPATLRSLGFRCAGQTSGGDRPGRPPTPTAWIIADPAHR